MTNNSVIWIENNVINFFAGKYRQPTNLFNWDSDVRAAFALKDTKRWQSLGDEINRRDWLISIHVIVDVTSKTWNKCNTIGDITTYIHGLYQRHRNLVETLQKSKDVSLALAAASTSGKGKKGKKTSKTIVD